MSIKHFDDNCAGCKPVLADPKTMKPLPDSDPAMRAIDAVWATTTREQRQAFHNITCNNSREPADLALVEPLIADIQSALDALSQKPN
jgi:hypothetical protein